MPHPRMPSITHALTAGESRLIRVAKGSRWIVAHGQAQWIEPARWLGERVVQVARTMGPGSMHRAERSGWVTLRARTEATLVCIEPSRTGSGWNAVWRMIRPARRALAPV